MFRPTLFSSSIRSAISSSSSSSLIASTSASSSLFSSSPSALFSTSSSSSPSTPSTFTSSLFSGPSSSFTSSSPSPLSSSSTPFALPLPTSLRSFATSAHGPAKSSSTPLSPPPSHSSSSSSPSSLNDIASGQPVPSNFTDQTAYEYYTGRQLIEARAANIPDLPTGGYDGTFYWPALILSGEKSRVVGCVGTANTPHRLLWFMLEEGPKHMCHQCGQYFKLVTPNTVHHVKHMLSEEMLTYFDYYFEKTETEVKEKGHFTVPVNEEINKH